MSVKIEYQKKYLQSVFGETKLIVDYILIHHSQHGFLNQYYVICEITGIKNCDLQLIPQSAKFIGKEDDMNEGTLVEEAAMELFEQSI